MVEKREMVFPDGVKPSEEPPKHISDEFEPNFGSKDLDQAMHKEPLR